MHLKILYRFDKFDKPQNRKPQMRHAIIKWFNETTKRSADGLLLVLCKIFSRKKIDL